MNLRLKKSLPLIVTALFALLCILAINKRQVIFDYWMLRGYEPSAQITQLAANTTMTDDGRHLFYVYHAELQGKEQFNNNCTNTEKSIVLGCYVQNRGIYIYDVKDPRLSGIKEVTAAHEMLHAAYDRLSPKQKARIDTLTQQVLSGLTNQRIIDSVQAYKDKDPSVVPNELHSILGTEVGNLPEELESYYAKYFSNRKKVVEYSENYEQVFSERQNQANSLLNQINETKKQIDQQEASLAAKKQSLDDTYNQLQSERATAQPGPFNEKVAAYNSSVRAYNAAVTSLSQVIDRHNNLVAEYNKVVVEEKELIKAIDSRPATIDTQ